MREPVKITLYDETARMSEFRLYPTRTGWRAGDMTTFTSTSSSGPVTTAVFSFDNIKVEVYGAVWLMLQEAHLINSFADLVLAAPQMARRAIHQLHRGATLTEVFGV